MILLTGGAGYIGSHTYLALRKAGYRVVILDDFSNAHRSTIDRLSSITGEPVLLEELSVLDADAVADVLLRHRVDAVIHFAAKKAVGESVEKPLDYFENNLSGLLALLRAMTRVGLFRLVFSSSATVYGEPDALPIREAAPRRYSNPYGFTKIACEQILEQLVAADPRWRIGMLRYFNPVGADPSGLIGEDPDVVPNNLMPYIAKVALGELPEVVVFGDDYDTPDGTGVRDYIHVSDLAEGHVLSLHALERTGSGHVVNLGTGRGYSVLEVIEAYSDACGRSLPYRIAGRRPGDVASCYADTRPAGEVLGFLAARDLAEMCRSSWAWVRNRRTLGDSGRNLSLCRGCLTRLASADVIFAFEVLAAGDAGRRRWGWMRRRSGSPRKACEIIGRARRRRAGTGFRARFSDGGGRKHRLRTAGHR